MDEAVNLDLASEQNLISGLIEFGFKSWAEISEVVQPSTFVIDSHQCLFKVADYVFKKHGDVKLDWPTLINGANSIGLQDFFARKEEKQYFKKIKEDFHVDLSNVKMLGTKLRKLEVCRDLRNEIKKADLELARITGDEKLSEILGKIENPMSDFAQYLRGIDSNGPELILKDLGKYLDYLENNPVDQIGIHTGFNRWDRAIGGGLIPGSVNLIGARAKIGKALRHGSLVYTKNGPVTIESLKIGDEVLTPDNKTSKVIAVYPQGKVQIYRVLFNDHTYVDCCENHLWKVQSYKSKTPKIVDVKYLLKQNMRNNGVGKRARFLVELTKPVEYDSHDLGIHPYILGILIGDGSLTHGAAFTSDDKEIAENVQNRLIDNYGLNISSKQNTKCLSYRITNLKRKSSEPNYYIEELKKYNLLNKTSHYKFIPQEYKYSSINNRIELLQGLMDTDGYVDIRGNCSYSTTSHQLAVDMQELITSLGGKCTIKEKCSACGGKGFFSYVLQLVFNDNTSIFKLTRKRNRTKIRQKKNITRKIEQIIPLCIDYATCITIEDDKGLFLTNNHIVTHNSALADNMLHYIVSQGIPCLLLDAEMHKKQHYNRLLAKVSKIPIEEIKTGRYSLNEVKKEKVRLAQKVIENLPYHYLNISGQNFEETLSEAKRWILNKVKLNSQGKANNCVIVLDYLKMMSEEAMSKNVSEFQKLGWMSSSFINFAIKYEIPCLSFLQLNREGIKSEETSVFAGSDRIIMHLSSASIFKAQSEEEIEKQREHHNKVVYNRKLLCKLSREGEGHEDGDYINIKFERSICDITEGPSLFELEAAGFNRRNEGNVADDDDGETPF